MGVLTWMAVALTVGLSERTADVVIYGGTPAGIAAALAAGSMGESVLLVEPTAWIGGMNTSGLSHTDFHSFESLSGTFWKFARRVEQYYRDHYGPNSAQFEASFRGTFGEPSVNLRVWQAMLAEHPSITVLTRHRLQTTRQTSSSARSDRWSIASADFIGPTGATLTATGRVFIDGTYEGDLLAAAGAAWRVGREGQSEWGESLAPAVPDGQLQAYNFRFILTNDPQIRTPIQPPMSYRADDFADLVPILRSSKIKKIFDYPANCIFKAQTPALPNHKYDINDVSRGLVRLSLPGRNLDWPAGSIADRQRIFDEHFRDQIGLLYFIQTDDRVPAPMREEARAWGYCRDEFVESGHAPPQLYVREARRLQGQHVFTQQDAAPAPGDARAVWHPDAIAMGDYGNNCHGTGHEGTRFSGQHRGEFYHVTPPYQIPYGVIVPKEVSNLLVPAAASSTHVGFCALRLEPIWTSLGQAAGHAARLAVERNLDVQAVPVAVLQTRLHADAAATIYVSDVPPDHLDFRAVQWWGALGGLHGLHPSLPSNRMRGAELHGQYSQASPKHDVQLDQPLDSVLCNQWVALARRAGLNVTSAPAVGTRGDWIRTLFKLHAP